MTLSLVTESPFGMTPEGEGWVVWDDKCYWMNGEKRKANVEDWKGKWVLMTQHECNVL